MQGGTLKQGAGERVGHILRAAFGTSAPQRASVGADEAAENEGESPAEPQAQDSLWRRTVSCMSAGQPQQDNRWPQRKMHEIQGGNLKLPAGEQAMPPPPKDRPGCWLAEQASNAKEHLAPSPDAWSWGHSLQPAFGTSTPQRPRDTTPGQHRSEEAAEDAQQPGAAEWRSDQASNAVNWSLRQAFGSSTRRAVGSGARDAGSSTGWSHRTAVAAEAVIKQGEPPPERPDRWNKGFPPGAAQGKFPGAPGGNFGVAFDSSAKRIVRSDAGEKAKVSATARKRLSSLP